MGSTHHERVSGELMFALRHVPSDLEAVEKALQDGASANYRYDKMNHHVLHYAVANNDIKLLELLIAYGARLDVFDDDGMTPLHDAVIKKHFECAHLLLEKGANIHAKGGDRMQPTPLHSALYRDNLENSKERMSFLLEHGADANEEDGCGKSVYAVADAPTAGFIRDYFRNKRSAEIEAIKTAAVSGMKGPLKVKKISLKR